MIKIICVGKVKEKYFNEAINELIAQDISKIMASNNIFVFNDRDNTEYKGSTSYEETNFLKVCDSCHHIYKQRVEQQLEGMRERESK